MRGAGIGNARNAVDFDFISPREHFAAVVAHFFDVHPLIARGRVAVINPQKRADFHFLQCRGDDLDALGRDEIDFAGAEFFVGFIAEVQIGERFKRRAVGVFFFAKHHGRSAHSVARRVKPLRGEDQNRHGALNLALGVTNALCNRILAVNQRRGKLGGVNFAAAHFEEMGRAVGKRLLDKCV